MRPILTVDHPLTDEDIDGLAGRYSGDGVVIRNGLGQVVAEYTETGQWLRWLPEPMVPTVCLLDHDCNAPPIWHWLFRRLPDPLWRWWLERHADDYVCP